MIHEIRRRFWFGARFSSAVYNKLKGGGVKYYLHYYPFEDATYATCRTKQTLTSSVIYPRDYQNAHGEYSVSVSVSVLVNNALRAHALFNISYLYYRKHSHYFTQEHIKHTHCSMCSYEQYCVHQSFRTCIVKF